MTWKKIRWTEWNSRVQNAFHLSSNYFKVKWRAIQWLMIPQRALFFFPDDCLFIFNAPIIVQRSCIWFLIIGTWNYVGAMFYYTSNIIRHICLFNKYFPIEIIFSLRRTNQWCTQTYWDVIGLHDEGWQETVCVYNDRHSSIRPLFFGYIPDKNNIHFSR